jgi:hypothetical protein
MLCPILFVGNPKQNYGDHVIKGPDSVVPNLPTVATLEEAITQRDELLACRAHSNELLACRARSKDETTDHAQAILKRHREAQAPVISACLLPCTFV